MRIELDPDTKAVIVGLTEALNGLAEALDQLDLRQPDGQDIAHEIRQLRMELT